MKRHRAAFRRFSGSAPGTNGRIRTLPVINGSGARGAQDSRI
jgi:hypothetical protein